MTSNAPRRVARNCPLIRYKDPGPNPREDSEEQSDIENIDHDHIDPRK